MQNYKLKTILLLVLFLGFFGLAQNSEAALDYSKLDCGDSDAATWCAATCDQANVQTAVDAASNGDTVFIPSGSCTWNTTAMCGGVTSAAICIQKAITLRGAGIDKTTISIGTELGSKNVILVLVDEPNAWRITGFTFKANPIVFKYYIYNNSTSKSWRIDNSKFTDIPKNGAYKVIGIIKKSYGVVDHNTFESSTTCPEWVYVEENLEGDIGYTAWQQPFSWGSANAVFIEDNTVNCASLTVASPAMDGSKGGKIVFRHNDVHNTNLGWHGLDSGNSRSFMAAEIYNNKFTFSGGQMSRVIQIRDGSALIYDNSASGQSSKFAELNNYRCIRQAHGWGACGTKFCSVHTKVGCQDDSDCSEQGYTGETCTNTDYRYKICSNTLYTACKSDSDCSGGTCSRMFCSTNVDSLCTVDSDCPNYPSETCSRYLDTDTVCRDQPGRTAPNQTLNPVYTWNNAYCNTAGCDSGCSDPINQGCTGATTGVATVYGGAGLDTCPQTFYTQEGRDYFNNIQKPSYTPFAYPHPLTLSDDITPPSAPTGVGIE